MSSFGERKCIRWARRWAGHHWTAQSSSQLHVSVSSNMLYGAEGESEWEVIVKEIQRLAEQRVERWLPTNVLIWVPPPDPPPAKKPWDVTYVPVQFWGVSCVCQSVWRHDFGSTAPCIAKTLKMRFGGDTDSEVQKDWYEQESWLASVIEQLLKQI